MWGLWGIAFLINLNSIIADDFEFKTEYKEPNYQGVSFFDFLDDNVLFYQNWREIGAVDLQSKAKLWKKDRYQNPAKLVKLTNNSYIITERRRGEKGEHFKLINPRNGDSIWSKFVQHEYETNYLSISSALNGDKFISVISPDEPTVEIKENCLVICLDPKNGEEIWKRNIDSIVLDSPTSSEEGVQSYIPLNAGGVECINVKDGETLWKFNDADEVKGSPSILNDSVFFCDFGGYVYSLNKDTGSFKWKTKLGGPIITTPITSKFNKLYITSLDGRIYCLNLSIGNIEWSNYGGWHLVTPPILIKKNLFLTSTDGFVYGFNAKTGNELLKGKTEFPFENIIRGGPLFSSPILYKNKLYYADNLLLHSVRNKTIPFDFKHKLFSENFKSSVKLKFESIKDTKYQIEVSNDLINWSEIKTIIGTGHEVLLKQDIKESSNSFYRLKLKE